MKLNKTQLTLLITAALLIVAIGYILNEKVDICETAKNDSYSVGTQEGILFWNSVVIQTVNEQKEIPYIFNNTIQYLPISQLCAGVQND